MCQEIKGDEDPDNKDDASDKDKNDQGAKIEHGCSSIKHDQWLIENFNLSQNFLMVVAQGLFCFISHKRMLLSRYAALRGSVEGNTAYLLMSQHVTYCISIL